MPLFLVLFLSLFFLLWLSSSLILVSHAASDTLRQGESLTDADGGTLVSSSDVFILGFFSPDNTSTNRYVGIWYHPNVSVTQDVVWVANRRRPISGLGGSIALSQSGDLTVLDGASNLVWSAGASGGSNATLQLMISGNLVISGATAGDVMMWQSFDHPTDTFLPEMQVGLNATTGEPRLFTSWASPHDPAPGNYSMGIDPQGSAQIFIWEDIGGARVRRWRSGEWNGHKFIGTVMRTLNIYGFAYNAESRYFSYTPHNASLLRFVLRSDGVEQTWMQSPATRRWSTVWEQPTDECEVYGTCGAYGSCSLDGEQRPRCDCLFGFQPRSVEEWDAGNWTGGCVRRSKLACNNTSNSTGPDGFWKVEKMKLPAHAVWSSNSADEADCRDACSEDCSCLAYAFSVSDISCLVWKNDLVDIYQSTIFDYDLNIKLAASELGDKDRSTKRVALISSMSALASLLILCVCGFLFWKYNARQKDALKMQTKKENLVTCTRLSGTGNLASDFSSSILYGNEKQEGKGSDLSLFTFDTIQTATNYFCESNKLGKGGFGYVYKGMLPGGQEVAVKRLSRSSGQGLEEFKTEVILISKLQHRNLVRLLGYCIQGHEKILIYEYLPNKSLDAILFDPLKRDALDWDRRFIIIEGIARGLLYLHRDSRLRIVHRDLKASNILLDENMNPKISDFGMARMFGGNENQFNTNHVVGTFGYMSPEYAMEGFFSVKSDIYSFGILILEIIIGQRNSSFHDMANNINIVGYAWQMWHEERVAELIDPLIGSSSKIDQVIRCVHIALLCVQDRVSDRPEIVGVIRMMDNETSCLPLPRQPTFIVERSETESTTNHRPLSSPDVIEPVIHDESCDRPQIVGDKLNTA
ncbi:G-type lectin S-receptor-like serine/threonine-protein kinase B120 isoform X1 [Zingiber officinale]|uniref:G-type lectin S-receptor-like serine/threonine-protein kinase B120 isoform X1 n=1 Tax=Zingiber officinale TaxID=94328 RepID=UPI001C4B5B93|nr:G-type lectin S-receptor-like serine/threonine-protein kinase B120 isoform X1 [Zingiber officinale]